MPVAPGCASVAYVIDDDVTFGLIPVGICSRCSRDTAEWPMFLSQLRQIAASKLSVIANKSAMRKAGFSEKVFHN